MVLLGRFQHRHFAAAGWAPGGPEVDHQGAAVQLAQVHRLALQVHQCQFRQLAALLQGRDQGIAAAPEAAAD
ncbi:hypothetical protein D3C85_1428530 [compost metagenome]